MVPGGMSFSTPNSVEVVASHGEWFVQITENGGTHSRSFDVEDYALAFAESQRVRLNLDRIEFM